MVCYDLEFAEMPRSVALRGADLLAVPTNWPWVDRPPGQPAPEVVIAMAAARTNHLPIACCDRTGVERGQRWNEATTVLSADGWPVGGPGEGGLLVADVDLARSADKRVSPRNDLLADRRPELYP
jgi:predicted amidohydrolase